MTIENIAISPKQQIDNFDQFPHVAAHMTELRDRDDGSYEQVYTARERVAFRVWEKIKEDDITTVEVR